jgi:chromosome segregation protein
MRLSKIKLSGFKSFVDPTTISFPSNLMGIVGPNGCGKSNVIDGIRWVLGESSAKTLRGDSMADVIFNGSSTRKPVGQASIELTFDNADGTLSGPYASYAEVSVRRVVSREGISQYYLNNARCRRKDITAILLGTGLGTHGYSIIEQGMISRLVEARPEELRAFLEEAAGISKYKERRKETGHRIRHTRENLERISDLREEVEKQLAHLQRQARAAERYQTLKAEERRLEAELLVLRLKDLRAELKSGNAQLDERELALEGALTEQGRIDAEIEKLRVAQAEEGERFNNAQGEYYRLGAEIARLEQSIRHRKETIQRQEKDLESTELQIEEIAGHIASDEIELEEIDKTLSRLNPELERAYHAQRNAESELEQADARMEDWRELWDRVSYAVADTQSAMQVEEARIEQIEEQQSRVDRDEKKYQAELSQIDSSEVERKLAALVANEEQLRAACLEANRGLEFAAGQIHRLREQEKKLGLRLDELRGGLQDDRGRLSSLEALQEVALGKTSAQLDGWLKSSDLEGAARLAESLTVESGWERAVETVLGGHLQAISVSSIDALAESLARIREGGLSLLESTDSDDRVAGETAGSTLADCVRSPTSVRPLLHGVRTANDLDDALAQRTNLGPGESVITKEGFWIGRSWLRISAGDDPRVGVIARSEEIERLREAVPAAARRVDEVGKALFDTRTRLEQLEELQAATQKEANRRQQLYAEVRTKLTSRRHELGQIRSRLSELDALLENLEAEREDKLTSAEECRRRLATAREELERLHDEREKLQAQRSDHLKLVEQARERADESREVAQEIAIRVESRRSTKESANAALARVQTQRERLLERQMELQSQLTAAQDPLRADEESLVAELDRHASAESNLSEARSRVEEVEAALREAEGARAAQRDVVQSCREEADGVRLRVREVQVRVETVSEEFAKTGMSLEEIEDGLRDDATQDAWHESLERVGRRIQRLGPINLAAIDEFEKQSERKKYLDAQYGDLTDALETLENAIKKIDRKTRARFRETFDKANQGMTTLFPKLFGGGTAYLELDGDDLLSSGVTVMARPPGKRISTIHL